eukprot:SAG31_NODE_39685_length_286_cov_1.021390_1_plen_21_part_01
MPAATTHSIHEHFLAAPDASC